MRWTNVILPKRAKLQNTGPLICISLSDKSAYGDIPCSTKSSDTCKWSGPAFCNHSYKSLARTQINSVIYQTAKGMIVTYRPWFAYNRALAKWHTVTVTAEYPTTSTTFCIQLAIHAVHTHKVITCYIYRTLDMLVVHFNPLQIPWVDAVSWVVRTDSFWKAYTGTGI